MDKASFGLEIHILNNHVNIKMNVLMMGFLTTSRPVLPRDLDNDIFISCSCGNSLFPGLTNEGQETPENAAGGGD